MHSFAPILEKWLARIQPARIIEWGPGRSTVIMRAMCPEAEIFSIEHDRKWMKPEYIHVSIPHNKPSRYDAWPLIETPGFAYDLAFIDGRRRAACLLAARFCLRAGGIAILHDARRKAYQHALSLMDIVEDAGHTIVLRKENDQQ